MNRLILVGNGFDLAHGLKTSYKDFIDDFWAESLKPISKEYGHRLINTEGLFEVYYDSPHYYIPQEIKDFNSLYNHLYSNDDDEKVLHLHYYNSFLEKLMTSFSDKNWVDIENEYYNELKKTKNIDKLNSDFEEIKNLLIKYFLKIYTEINFNEKIINNITTEFNIRDINNIDKFRESIIKKCKSWEQFANSAAFNDFPPFFKNFILNVNSLNDIEKNSFIINYFDKLGIYKKQIANFHSEQILFLNFNYTNTITDYLSKIKNSNINFLGYNISKINIHGELNNPENPIIFGFGDDVDKKYQEFEDLNDNRYLENFKSIAYLQTDNYKKLLEFIDSEEYQVFIFGHSCGISDRTMLNTIFEHDNCKSIKPFYHKREDGTDNYTEIVQNISRNFNDKKKYRDRVVNKTYCEPLT